MLSEPEVKFQKSVCPLANRSFDIRSVSMTFSSHAGFRGKPGGAVLSSSLGRGREYAERTRHLGEERMLACRAVLILTEMLVLLMPLTEHFCRWDKFLRGGPDVEFGILSLLLFAGLVLLTAYRAVTAPFLMLLAYRLIALPLRCLRISGVASFLLPSQCSQKTSPDPWSIPGTLLRI
jgi:hypothetical protein